MEGLWVLITRIWQFHKYLWYLYTVRRSLLSKFMLRIWTDAFQFTSGVPLENTGFDMNAQLQRQRQ